MNQVIPLYPQEYPAQIPAEKQEQLNESGHIKNVHFPTLTVSLPEKSKATGKAIVICPGGGYGILAAGHEGVDIARMLNSIGVAAFILKYRLPPDYRHPLPMQDAQRAIRTVRANASKWGIRPDAIGILGFSAGGHLASTAATHFDDGKTGGDAVDAVSCRPDFAVLCYPVISFVREYCHGGSRSNLLGTADCDDLRRCLSADLQVTEKTPPTFLFHSQDDGAVDPRNSIEYFLACKEKGVPAELHLFPKGGHGFGLGKPGSNESQWPMLLQRWMQNL